MDIPRPDIAKKKKARRIIYTGAGFLAVLVITVALSRLEPAAPSVNRSTVYKDTVRRGSMLRQVRGPGKLVPEQIRWISARTDGRIERRMLPGIKVEADTVLLEMSNPELEQVAREAEFQLGEAEAEFADLKVQLESQLLNQQAEAAKIQAEHNQARLQAEADKKLHGEGLVGDLIVQLSSERAKDLAVRHELEQEQLEIAKESVTARLAARRARVEQFRALAGFRHERVEALKVSAGIDGVLQQVLVEEGQRVTPGTILAKVAQPGKLKAELRIAETQAKDIEVGQKATIDTRNGLIDGEVIRVDPAVQEGTVQVDVALISELPKGARPDLSVDGTVELERLEDILYVRRPAYGQAESTIGLFRILEDGETAVRVQVQLGRSSVSTIEVVRGLNESDQVIISDTSAWDSYDRIRLN